MGNKFELKIHPDLKNRDWVVLFRRAHVPAAVELNDKF